MPLRLYAIGFLGVGEYRQAIPVLEEIVRNENDDLRGSALFAIHLIDEQLGKKFALEFLNENSKFAFNSYTVLSINPREILEMKDYSVYKKYQIETWRYGKE